MEMSLCTDNFLHTNYDQENETEVLTNNTSTFKDIL